MIKKDMKKLPILENGCRRQFCKEALIVSGLVLSGSAVSTLISGCETDTSKVSTEPTGETFTIDTQNDVEISKLVDGQGIKRTVVQNGKSLNNGTPVIIVRINENEYKVFTSLCTHELNPIYPPDPLDTSRADGGVNMWCSFHGSFFDPSSGSPIAGPAPKPLREFTTQFVKPNLTING